MCAHNLEHMNTCVNMHVKYMQIACVYYYVLSMCTSLSSVSHVSASPRVHLM